MEKLIIENRTDLPMTEALELATKVVAAGRTSNNGTQYCYLTLFSGKHKGYAIASSRNKKSDKLTLYKDPRSND